VIIPATVKFMDLQIAGVNILERVRTARAVSELASVPCECPFDRGGTLLSFLVRDALPPA